MEKKEKRMNYIRNSGRWTDVFPIAIIITGMISFFGTLLTYAIMLLTKIVDGKGSFFDDLWSMLDSGNILYPGYALSVPAGGIYTVRRGRTDYAVVPVEIEAALPASGCCGYR